MKKWKICNVRIQSLIGFYIGATCWVKRSHAISKNPRLNKPRIKIHQAVWQYVLVRAWTGTWTRGKIIGDWWSAEADEGWKLLTEATCGRTFTRGGSDWQGWWPGNVALRSILYESIHTCPSLDQNIGLDRYFKP